MESRMRYLRLFLLSTCLIFHLTGCSLIGYLGGSIIDAAIPDEYVFTPKGVDSIKHGQTVNVIRTEGTILSGEFAGLETRQDENYVAAFRDFTTASPLGKNMPKPGDSLWIVTHGALGRSEQSGRFVGFSKDAIRLQSFKYEEDIGVLLEYIDSVYHPRGPTVIGDTLRHYVTDGTIPTLRIERGMLISTNDGKSFVPIDAIKEVRSLDSNNRKWWGLGIGAASDAASIIGLWANHWDLFAH